LAGAADFAADFLPGAPAVVFFGAAFFGAGAVATFFAVAVVVFFVATGFFALDVVAAAFVVVVFLEGASAFLTGAFFTAAGFLADTGFAFLNVR
jgi:hypothetical protein